MDHLYREVDERNFYCSQHLMQFTSPLDYEYHKRINCLEMLTSPLKCFFEVRGSVCGYQSGNVREQIIHTREAHKRTLCGSCGRLFVSMEHMEGHVHVNQDVLKSK